MMLLFLTSLENLDLPWKVNAYVSIKLYWPMLLLMSILWVLWLLESTRVCISFSLLTYISIGFVPHYPHLPWGVWVPTPTPIRVKDFDTNSMVLLWFDKNFYLLWVRKIPHFRGKKYWNVHKILKNLGSPGWDWNFPEGFQTLYIWK